MVINRFIRIEINQNCYYIKKQKKKIDKKQQHNSLDWLFFSKFICSEYLFLIVSRRRYFSQTSSVFVDLLFFLITKMLSD